MKVSKNKPFFIFTLVLIGGLSMAIAKESVIKEISKCPKSPNCVSTLTDSKQHKMEPWPAGESGILKKVKAAALKDPRVRLVSESDSHLQFTFTSLIFRFVDDAWFALKDGKVHYKSASRTGHGDLGVNKKRMERIKARVYK